MKYRTLGKTGQQVSEISFGAWAIGGSWGAVDDVESLNALNAAIDHGVNFIDTADVYGDGRSEKIIAKLAGSRKEKIVIATKAGRRSSPHNAASYNKENLTAYIERSLQNLQVEALDLVQLHCPPNDVYYRPEVFGALDDLVKMGKIKHYGVSVEKVEEALKAIEYPNVATVQIIFNMFRERPAELFFAEANKKNVGIIVRVPLASGLLTGKMTSSSKFAIDDHRNYNRHGEAFDRGETFAGVDFETGLQAVAELKSICPTDFSMPQFALKWILMYPEVSCIIPGAKHTAQVIDNTKTSDLPSLSPVVMEKVTEIYQQKIKTQVHQLW
jgi:aryl-alcohol dehydrogenase-like predicted oxidoreductase